MSESEDESHLRLLSIFHYVLAVPAAVLPSMFLMHFFWGLSIWRGVPFLGQPEKDPPPAALGLFLMAAGAGIAVLGWSLAACLIVAGRSLVQRKRYLFCLIVAGLMCVMCNPLGTVLGVFTIIVLMRPSVKGLFGVSY
jgi:hypothetical protein